MSDDKFRIETENIIMKLEERFSKLEEQLKLIPELMGGLLKEQSKRKKLLLIASSSIDFMTFRGLSKVLKEEEDES